MRRIAALLSLCVLSMCTSFQPAAAQRGAAGSPLYVQSSGLQELFPLVRANVSAGAFTVYGGRYLLSQTCTSYNSGSLTLTTPGPGGTGTMTLVSKTAADTTSTAIDLGSNATVTTTLPTGSTGCVADLARVPQ